MPSVNKQLDKCSALIGQPRLTCYETLDKKLMTKRRAVGSVDVVVRDPHHGPNVTHWTSTSSAARTGYAHVAVK